MATTVQDNPFDTQQPSATNTTPTAGLIGSQLTQVAPSNVTSTAPVTPNVATYNPTTRSVDKETGTVQGQVASILASDSPLMQRARTLATQQMAQRGLVNSSMAQGAGVAAMTDRALPMAQQDANAFNEAARDNQGAINQAGQFNAGELNRFGLQRGEQQFQAQQADIQRQFQTSERLGGQQFTSSLEVAKQNFQAAQAQLDRAQQTALSDKSIEAQQALQAAQQNFASAQSALDRQQQTALQQGQQAFQAGQSALDREQQMSVIDRQAALQKDLATTQQTFQASQAALDRAQQVYMADKTYENQLALQKAQQDFTASQTSLDRAQQAYLQQSQQNFQQSMATQEQTFRAAQATLDRQQQAFLQDDQQAFQQNLTNSQIPANFALQISNTTASSINAIAADPNLSGTPDGKDPPGSSPKSRAIQSALNYANSQIAWANKFYGTTIPGLPTA